jgi:hypothetical protein
MKTFLMTAAAVLALSAGSASAFDFGTTGVALNTEVTSEYNIDTELFTVVSTPELAFSPVEGLGLYVNTDLTIYDGAEVMAFSGDAFEGLTVGATYVPNVNLGKTSVELYIEADFDADFNREQAVLGATLSF